jgi:hypothetical protein
VLAALLVGGFRGGPDSRAVIIGPSVVSAMSGWNQCRSFPLHLQQCIGEMHMADTGQIQGMNHHDKGDELTVDHDLSSVSPA